MGYREKLFQLIALDLDGTLCASDHKVPLPTVNSLVEYQEMGTKVAIVSGRPQCGVNPVADLLKLQCYGGYILPFNGAFIQDYATGEKIFSSPMPEGCALEIMALADQYHCDCMLYDETTMVTNNASSKAVRAEALLNGMTLSEQRFLFDSKDKSLFKAMIWGRSPDLERIRAALGKLYSGALESFIAEPGYLDIVAAGVNKGSGLERLASFLRIQREEIVAFGDSYNDIPMLCYAGTGVAMANAFSDVKQMASYVTLSCDEEGVADFLKRCWLRRSTTEQHMGNHAGIETAP